MNENKIRIVGLLVEHPVKHGEEIQNIFSKFGCSIKTRMGLNVDNLSDAALMILELYGSDEESEKLINSLSKLNDVQVQQMSFE